MAKDKLTDYDATAGNNTDIGGISVDEGMLPSNVNNALRELMSHLKDFAAGTEAVDAVAINGDLTVDTNTLVVDSTNNRVGVGTASPAQPLHFKGSAVQFENTQNTYLQVNTADTHLYTAAAHPLRFGTNSTERMRILSGGGLTFNGDTAAANALDSYEEGSWSPTYTALSTNPTAAYNVQIGRYVKVGQIVMASFRIQTSSNSGGVGSIFVAGLPFASENVTSMFTAGVVGYSATWVSHAPQSLFLGANSTQIQPLRNQTADAFSVISVGVDSANFSNVNGGNDLMGTITYRTSS
ncbi:hypothetical protein [uncultured Mediterranean phage uvMED]|nr:hypothetical protein [uncultured Mediterranean phage uvMED]